MNYNQIIGENLKRLRADRRLSLSQLAEICDVSKVVLSQIEKGDANPTVNTVWKIATGLKVPYTELLDENTIPTTLIRKNDTILQTDLNGAYKTYTYCRLSNDYVFDLCTVELLTGTQYISQGHLPGCKEYLLVNRGTVKIIIGTEEFLLEEGDCICFDGCQTHTYINTGAELLNFTSILYY